jgi:tripartite-type tricarboxylate transporter receptor subunit TctC
VHPSVPVKNVQELIAYAKANPGKLLFSSIGVGSGQHLAMELFRMRTGVDMLHVPYKGTALSLPDLANGRVSILFDNIVSAQPNLRSGTVKALAVTSLKRSALMPELPTLAEEGLPGFESIAWFALFGPAGLPADIVKRLQDAALAALQAGDARERLAAAGGEPSPASGEEVRRLIRTDMDKWARVVKAAHVKVD